MKAVTFLKHRYGCPVLAATLVTTIVWLSPASPALGAPPNFGDEKTLWHGFDRYDFLMDEATFTLKPIKAAPDEKMGSVAR
jgi:hypothetical protein